MSPSSSPRSIPTWRFIIPHLGSFADDWRAQLALIDHLARHPNLHADTSGVRRFDLLEEAIRRAGRASSSSGRTGRGSIPRWSSPRSAPSVCPRGRGARPRWQFPPSDRRRAGPADSHRERHPGRGTAGEGDAGPLGHELAARKRPEAREYRRRLALLRVDARRALYFHDRGRRGHPAHRLGGARLARPRVGSTAHLERPIGHAELPRRALEIAALVGEGDVDRHLRHGAADLLEPDSQSESPADLSF